MGTCTSAAAHGCWRTSPQTWVLLARQHHGPELLPLAPERLGVLGPSPWMQGAWMGSTSQLELRGWSQAASGGGPTCRHSCCPHLKVPIKVTSHLLPASGPLSRSAQPARDLQARPSSVVEVSREGGTPRPSPGHSLGHFASSFLGPTSGGSGAGAAGWSA